MSHSSYRQLKFSRASQSYDDVSDMQREMARVLFSLLPKNRDQITTSTLYPSILELGCGTGNFSEYLINGIGERVVLSDASECMLELCKNKLLKKSQAKVSWHKIYENQKLPFENLDLICSNALVQWFENFEEHLSYVHKVLKQKGYFLFSGFCQSNFPELQSVLREPPFQFTQFPGHSLNSVVKQLNQKDFLVVKTKEDVNEYKFADLEEFVRYLKALGANGKQNFVMTREKWKHLKQVYGEVASSGKGVKATWKPWYVLAQKKI